MDNVLITRIKERLHDLGKSAKSVSVEATGATDTLRKILDGTTKNPRIDTLEKLAAALATTPDWLVGRRDGPPDMAIQNADGTTTYIEAKSMAGQSTASDVRPAAVPLPSRFDMPDDVPVRGTAAGSHLKGAFQFTSDAIDYVRRPPALMGARDIYALYVEGSSMEPQYFPGDLVYVHPHKPPRTGDVIVVQAAIDDVNVEATLGVYVKRTEQYLVIRKRNPDAQVQLNRKTVKAIHKVLTTNELFGV